MPSLRSATATAVAFAPVAPAEVEGAGLPAPQARIERRENGPADRRARPERTETPVVFAIDQPRRANVYTKVIDLALVLACLAIFIGVLAVGILG